MSERKRRVVLIADDEPNNRLLVHATIKLEHFVLLEASNGEEAWSIIQRYHPSLVLLDVQMPPPDGLEILRRIRSDPDLAKTRVILLTAHSRQRDIDAGLAAGADIYLTKPFSPLELLASIEMVFGL